MGKPVESFEETIATIRFTCSFWLLCEEQCIKGQEWTWGSDLEAEATIQARDEGSTVATEMRRGQILDAWE